MQLQAILEFLGGTAIVVTALSYLGGKAIDAFVTGGIESYKSRLEKIALEHSVRFSSLHLKRADIIAEIYELLSDLENQSRLLATPIRESGEPPKSVTNQSAADLYYRLYEKFNKTRIYFPDDICKLVDKFLSQSSKAMAFYKLASHLSLQDPDGKQKTLQDSLQEKWLEMWEDVEVNVPKARSAIEDEFRKILGVENQ